MLTFDEGSDSEVGVRVFVESSFFGREYFDSAESLRECVAMVARLTRACLKESQQDGIARQVGIAVVPAAEYGDPEAYGFDSQ